MEILREQIRNHHAFGWDYSSGLEVHDAAVALLEAALRLVFGRPGTEDVIGTRRRIRQLVDLFSVDVSLPRAMRLQVRRY